MTPSLTIVLPFHNAERIVNRTVHDILDVTQAATDTFAVILVDNGSSDDTYETAYQLSRCYPQITVLWLPIHSGLGMVIELVRTRVTTDRILIHDGVTPIHASQLGLMLTRESGQQRKEPHSSTNTTHGLRRFAPILAFTENMRLVHQTGANPVPPAPIASQGLTGFQWIPQAKPLPVGRRVNASRSNPLPALPHTAFPGSMAGATGP